MASGQAGDSNPPPPRQPPCIHGTHNIAPRTPNRQAIPGSALLSLYPAVASATELEDAAAGLRAAQWTVLATEGIDEALGDDVEGGVGHVLPYADKLHWDPATRRAYYAGSDDPGDGRRFVAYDEASNPAASIDSGATDRWRRWQAT